MYISISYFESILVAQVWFLCRWVRCYELLYVHMCYLPFNRVASWVQWNCCRDAVIIWYMGIPMSSCRCFLFSVGALMCQTFLF
jgi:hypothetical protein